MNLKHILGLAALAGYTGAFAQVNAPDNLGDLVRSRALLSVRSYHATMDQLRRLDRYNLHGQESENAALERAEALFGDGRYAAARQAFAEFCIKYPYSTDRSHAAVRAADCLYAEGRYDEALSEYKAIDPDGLVARHASELHYNSGVCAWQTGDTQLAIRELKQAGRSSDYRSSARFYLGVIAYDKGDYAEARSYFGGTDASVAPGDMSQYYLVSIDLAEGKYQQAARGARSLLQRGGLPAGVEAEMNRVAGEALYREGEKEEGTRYMRKYLASTKDPLPSACYIVGVDDYENGDYADAVELLRHAADSDDAVLSQSAYLYIGQALHHSGDPEAAILAFKKASDSDADPDVREAAYFNYAAAKFGGAAMPFASSVDAFERFIELYPDGPYSDRVREYLVSGYVSDNDYERALLRVEAIRNPGPEALKAKQRIYYVLGSQALARRDYAKADSYLERAAKLASQDAATAAEVILLQGESLAAQGKNTAAAAKFNDYISRTPRTAANRTQAYYGLGYALMSDRKYDRARKAFSAIIDDRSLSAVELADVLNRLGDLAYYDSDFSTAADMYRKAFDASPKTGDYAAFNGARMLGFMRNYDSKLAAIRRFMLDFPSSVLIPDALLEETQALISLGRNEEAVEAYRSLVTDYSGTSQGRQGYLQMAMTLLDMGRREQAKEAYREVISRYPTSDEALQASSLLKNIYAEDHRGDEYLAFMESVENAPEVSASDTESLTYDAAVREFANTSDASALEAFVARYPDSSRTPEALRKLAEADYEAGRTPEALEKYKTMQQKASTGTMATEARLGIMRSARDLGDYDLAGATADAILQSSAAPTALREATYTRAMALAAADKTSEALAVWQELAEDPSDVFGARSAVEAAEALLEQGKTEQARKAAQAFVGSGSPQRYWVARGFIVLSDTYISDGKKFEAKEYLEALKENYPGSETDIQSMIEERLGNIDKH